MKPTRKAKMARFFLMPEVHILKGDITSLDGDHSVSAIVNAANSHLLHDGGVARAIRDAGGDTVERESRAQARHQPLMPGDATWTNAGDIPADYVIHAITMMQPGSLTNPTIVGQATRSALTVATILGCESVAFPALGAGVGGVKPLQCAQAMLMAVRRWYASEITMGMTVPTRLSFVLFDDQLTAAFGSSRQGIIGNP